MKALELAATRPEFRERLWENTRYFRRALAQAGFALPPGEEHPFTPIMLGDARRAQAMAARLLEEGVYAIGFFYPVVPEGAARIRTQVSAAHRREHLDRAVEAFAKARRAA